MEIGFWILNIISLVRSSIWNLKNSPLYYEILQSFRNNIIDIMNFCSAKLFQNDIVSIRPIRFNAYLEQCHSEWNAVKRSETEWNEESAWGYNRSLQRAFLRILKSHLENLSFYFEFWDLLNTKLKIPNLNLQITNKFQIPIIKIQNHRCTMFGYCDLYFGYYPPRRIFDLWFVI